MANSDPIYGLVCAGGGAHGAYQVGVLSYIHEHFSAGDRSPFQVFSGTSCGNLNTTFFACHSFDAKNARLRLEELWLGFDVPSYHGSVVRGAIGSFVSELFMPGAKKRSCWSILDPKPLEDITREGFDREGLEKAFEKESTLAVAISATELRSGKLCFFVEGKASTSWSIHHSTGLQTHIGPSHIQASCTVPIALPPVEIGGFYYVDGGASDRRPLTPAFNMGATRILSIATDRPHPKHLPAYPADYRPQLGDVVSMLVGQLSHDYASDQAFLFEVVNYFYDRAPEATRNFELDPSTHAISGDQIRPEAYRPVEIFSFVPSRRIRHSEIYKHELLDPADPSSRTLFMFKEEFVRKLIDFGYKDAHARHDELAEFLDRNRPQDPRRYAQMIS